MLRQNVIVWSSSSLALAVAKPHRQSLCPRSLRIVFSNSSRRVWDPSCAILLGRAPIPPFIPRRTFPVRSLAPARASREAHFTSSEPSSKPSDKMCALPQIKLSHFLLLVLCVLYPFMMYSFLSNKPQVADKSALLPSQTLRHIPAKSLYVSTPTWWLESRFHFNFAEYYNPQNSDFGVLRVLNDDLVKPKAGFGTHGHRDMEIFTYIVDGQLTHKDSIGTSETLGRGSAQYMSAGKGIRHSEMNNDRDLLRFLQIWIKPERSGLKPNYGSRVFKKEDRHNKIQHVLTSFDKYDSDKDLGEGVIPVHQDCNIYVSEADANVEQEFVLPAKRQAYLVCIEGSLSVSDLVQLETRDAVEIKAEEEAELPLVLRADETKGAHFLLIEMALAYFSKSCDSSIDETQSDMTF